MFSRSMAFGLAASLAAAAPALSQDDTETAAADSMPNENAVNCVSLSRVENTRIMDDQTVLFYLRGGDIYRNSLPHRCPGLDTDSAFMYRVTTPQLCSIDVITLLDNFGSRFMPAASCGLGKFEPISETEAEDMIRVAERDDGNDGA